MASQKKGADQMRYFLQRKQAAQQYPFSLLETTWPRYNTSAISPGCMFPVLDNYAPRITIKQAQSPCKMNNLKENLNNVRARVESACKKAGRSPSGIVILAVSKKHPVERIRALHDLGQVCFGENYVQEALAKMDQL
ncbi:MAG: hypothetical protein OES53_15995, partial [Xanthomonadales bacterium]|nr:hypothetical protein [Xanthomonadales bacterium]